MKSFLINLLVAFCAVQLTSGEVIMGSNVRLALKTRAEAESTLRWCYVFFQEDFPEDTICAGKPDGTWDYFPSCCNGAYYCRDEMIYKSHLCPPENIYDEVVDDCVPFTEEVCPYRGNTGSDDGDITTEDPIELNCGNVDSGRIPHPQNCNKYIDCANGEVTVVDCFEDYIYYAPFSVCLPGNVVTCKLNTLE